MFPTFDLLGKTIPTYALMSLIGIFVSGIVIFVLALTTALGFSVLHFQPFAEGTTWLDFWDFIVSNNILPLGSLVLALFCCNKFGWLWC